MKEEELQFKKYVEDLASRAYKNSTYTYTKFLDLAKGSLARQITDFMPASEYEYFGGSPDCERVVLRFGNPDEVGYEECFPVSIIEIRPINAKFADAISHRDVLGAVLNLGLAREVIGDIIVAGNVVYLFCLENVEAFICENLVRIKHTTVNARVSEVAPEQVKPTLKELVLIVPSLRVDVLISKIYHISRSESELLFSREKVYINGKLCNKSGIPLKNGDVISARGFGKFIFEGELSTTKKGNLSVMIKQYV